MNYSLLYLFIPSFNVELSSSGRDKISKEFAAIESFGSLGAQLSLKNLNTKNNKIIY